MRSRAEVDTFLAESGELMFSKLYDLYVSNEKSPVSGTRVLP